jgi:hypothetical protein
MRHMPLADSGAPDARAGANDGWMDIRLAVSRDGGANFSFPSRDAFLRRGIGARDAASGLYNASGSEPDAGFVFATNGGVLDADAAAPHIYLLYWGSQTTHAGGGAYLARYSEGARTGIFRARLRREGWAGLATLPHAPTGAGAARTVALRLPQGQPALFLRFNAAVDAAGQLSVALLSEAVRLAPGAERVHLAAARAALARGDEEACRGALQAATALNARSADATVMLASLHFRGADVGAAIGALSALLDAAPQTYAVMRKLAVLLRRAGRASRKAGPSVRGTICRRNAGRSIARPFGTWKACRRQPLAAAAAAAAAAC